MLSLPIYLNEVHLAKISPNSTNPTDQIAAPTPNNTIQVGIDWADKELSYSTLLSSGTIKTGSFKQNKAGVEEWTEELSKLAPDCNIDVCIETSSGALINALMEYAQVRVFPVNPLALANYRNAFAPGEGKNDPVDARLIMQFLQHYLDVLRQLVPNSPETRELTALAQVRRQFVDQFRIGLTPSILKICLISFDHKVALIDAAVLDARVESFDLIFKTQLEVAELLFAIDQKSILFSFVGLGCFTYDCPFFDSPESLVNVGIRACVRFVDHPDWVYVTPAVTALTIPDRSNAVVAIYTSHDLPQSFWSRDNKKKVCHIKLDVPSSKIEIAELCLVAWTGGPGSIENYFDCKYLDGTNILLAIKFNGR